MSIQLTNFTQRYEQAIKNIKIIKVSNQRINENTAVNIKHEGQIIQSSKEKILAWIDDMERTYLDPQTARRVDIVKQQLSNQLQKYTQHLKVKNNQQIIQSEQQNEGNLEYTFDHDHESKMMKQKNKDLQEVHSKLINIHQISQETQRLTYKQGEDIDIIGENIGSTLDNTRESNSYLEEAQKQQKKSQKKYAWLIGSIIAAVVFLVVIIILII